MKYGIPEIYSKRYERALKTIKKIDNAGVSESNKKVIKQFQAFISSTGSGQLRVAKLTQQLLSIIYLKKFDLAAAEKGDIIAIIGLINNRNTYSKHRYGRDNTKTYKVKTYSEATKADYRRCIKQFYSWYKEEDLRVDSEDRKERIIARKLYHYIEKNVSSSSPRIERDPSLLLTNLDIQKVLDEGCKEIREKALIRFLHESGVRSGELLNMKWKDIKSHRTHMDVTVTGKTGMRTIQIVKSKNLIAQWHNHTPDNNGNAFIWLGKSPSKPNAVLKHVGVSKLIKKCFKRVGLEKPCNLHWFRHSRASINGTEWTEPVMRLYFGWTPGSDMPTQYCHTSKKQLLEACKSLNGISIKSDEDKHKALTCACGTINDNICRYCNTCGTALKVEYLMEDEQKVKIQNELSIDKMIEMFSNPKNKASFDRFVKLMEG